jgi:hypothetical protein
MRSEERTIRSGIESLEAKAAYHAKESERFKRLAQAMREGESELNSEFTSGIMPKGRKADSEGRQIVLKAIETMPHKFTFSQLKGAVNGSVEVNDFRRFFREIRKEGFVKEVVRAAGMRDGEYLKIERAVATDDHGPKQSGG